MTFHVVHLSRGELELSMIEANRRNNQCKQLKLKPRLNAPVENTKALKMNVAGAIGEMAAAKFLKLKDYVFTFNSNWGVFDLPPNLDVKTALGHQRRLQIFKDEKNPDKIFIHATFKHNELRLHGWTYGKDVMLPHFLDNPAGRGESYFVPSTALRSMNDLLDYLTDLGYSK